MKRNRIVRICAATVIAVLLSACDKTGPQLDGLHRSRVDAMNKVAFQSRFRDTDMSEYMARKALAYIDDSLPQYDDGRLRAWNNLATAFYFQSKSDSVMRYVDSVVQYKGHSNNMEIEQLLAHLMEARIRQRNCDIAGSYQILYNIEQSGLLERTPSEGQNFLYNLAQSEMYITTTVLNYHYRSKSQYQHAELLTHMEEQRESLRCDYAEDMSLNYAIAYGYSSLCEDTEHQSEYLGKALQYCADNLRLMTDSSRYSTYHLGDTYQLIGFMLWSDAISDHSWDENSSMLNYIYNLVHEAFGFDVTNEEDITFAFLREATALFWLHNDRYQRLGAIVATGRYCLSRGDTATARTYFNEALIDTTLLGIAPKFEAMLYEGFLVSGCAQSQADVANWTRKEIDLLKYIQRNEKADFLLQQELTRIGKLNYTYLFLIILLVVLTLALGVLIVLLRRRSKALQRETRRLQEAQQQDVERIANVETCLSVMRHDINPFISYLQNDNLPEELKREVTGQLVRTFENIKNWTNLSIPSGLQFRCTTLQLQDVFDRVEACINNFRGDMVKLHFEPTPLYVRGDMLLLEILLRNLVNNAVQHTTEGRIDIRAAVDANPAFVQVSVQDTGCGMDADEVDNLFRADKKPHPAANGGGFGSGFGLILCRYIVKKHDDNTLRGCRIWAESEPGKGTTFHFLVEKAPEAY